MVTSRRETRIAGALALLLCSALGCSSKSELPRVDLSCLESGLPNVRIERLERAELDSLLEALQPRTRDRAETVERLFREAGCGEQLRLEEVTGSRPPNVICRLPGRGPQRVVVGAHYNSAGGEGAVDNWSGTALLPALYRSLANEQRELTFDFIAFNDEETQRLIMAIGEPERLGSRIHVRGLSEAQRAETLAMLNLHTLGPSRIKVDAYPSDAKLKCLLAGAAGLAKLPLDFLTLPDGSTNDEPFTEVGIPAITVHGLPRAAARFFGGRDRLADIDRAAYYDSYVLLAAYLAILDQRLSAPPAPGS